MYSKTTKGVTVTVTPYFLDDQSSPNEGHYVWAYQVNIKNLWKPITKSTSAYEQIMIIKTLGP